MPVKDDGEPGVSLRDFIALRFDDHDRLHEEQAKALAARIDDLTKTVQDLSHQASTHITREYYEERHTDLDKRIQELERSTATNEALDGQQRQLEQMRRNLLYTVAGGVILVVVDILLAALKK